MKEQDSKNDSRELKDSKNDSWELKGDKDKIEDKNKTQIKKATKKGLQSAK